MIIGCAKPQNNTKRANRVRVCMNELWLCMKPINIAYTPTIRNLRNICFVNFILYLFACRTNEVKCSLLRDYWLRQVASVSCNISYKIWGPCYWHGLTWIPAWISNYIRYNVRDEITYPFPNFNGAVVEFYEWQSNFTSHFTGHMIWEFIYQHWGHCCLINDLGSSPLPEGEARGLWWASQVVN